MSDKGSKKTVGRSPPPPYDKPIQDPSGDASGDTKDAGGPSGADHQDIAEAQVCDVIRRGETTYLELQVNIEGRCHRLLLAEDDLSRRGWTYPAAVAELNMIRQSLHVLLEGQNKGNQAFLELTQAILATSDFQETG